ncbi:MAG: 6,7-dimethyl-8-ribityllumazine synthase [Bacteroidales bacterium]|nr:6,7-dimethyl-8-ribityllumazine synthase [Bacteroidales bacterium]
MGTTNFSEYDPEAVPYAEDLSFGIVVSDWNREITWALLDETLLTLRKHGVNKDNIVISHVPGSFELPLGAQILADNTDVEAIICLGCVIQGETPHFTYICQGVTQGIMQLNLDYNIPFVFGVLTTENRLQALDRAGGKYGNKGTEAALTAIRMAALQRDMGKD